MARDKICTPFLALASPENKFTVSTIEDMQSRKYLKIGDVVELNGYYTAGDGAGHKRKIEVADDGSGVQLVNGLWANIVHSGEVNVSWFGAKGDGVTDDSVYLRKSLLFPNVNLDCNILLQSPVYINDNVSICSLGKSIIQNENFLRRTSDEGTLRIKGVVFKGSGVGIECVIDNYIGREQNLSFIIEECEFENTDFGISLQGLREGYIKKCKFTSIAEAKNNGIRRSKTVNTFVDSCYFKDTKYMVLDDGDDSPYSCGLRIFNCVALGCEFGIVSYGVDQCDIQNNMIDYCDNPIVFSGGVEGSIITNNYITSRKSIYVLDINNSRSDIQDKNKIILIYGNTFINHSENGRIANLSYINSMLEFNNNICHFYTDLALNISNVESGVINGNYFRKRSSYVGETNTINFNNLNTIFSFIGNDFIESNINIGNILYNLSSRSSGIVVDTLTTRKKATLSGGVDILKTSGVGSFSDELVVFNFFRGGTVGAALYLENTPTSANNGVLNLLCKEFKINGTIVYGSISQLNTPYHTTKMQQEGIYDDFIAYMDEQHEYEQSQREVEEKRQKAYQLALTENAELTYEEWLSGQPQLMPFVEPQPSQALLDFKEKYLG